MPVMLTPSERAALRPLDELIDRGWRDMETEITVLTAAAISGWALALFLLAVQIMGKF